MYEGRRQNYDLEVHKEHPIHGYCNIMSMFLRVYLLIEECLSVTFIKHYLVTFITR